MAKVNPIQVQKFLKGMNYPADKQTLVEKAEEEGADDETMSALQQLPEDEFTTPAEVSAALGQQA